jgi:hypothetical protein
MKTILLTTVGLALGILIGILIGIYARRPSTVLDEDWFYKNRPSIVKVYEVTLPGNVDLGYSQFLGLSCTSDKAGNPQCFIASK